MKYACLLVVVLILIYAGIGLYLYSLSGSQPTIKLNKRMPEKVKLREHYGPWRKAYKYPPKQWPHGIEVPGPIVPVVPVDNAPIGSGDRPKQKPIKAQIIEEVTPVIRSTKARLGQLMNSKDARDYRSKVIKAELKRYEGKTRKQIQAMVKKGMSALEQEALLIALRDAPWGEDDPPQNPLIRSMGTIKKPLMTEEKTRVKVHYYKGEGRGEFEQINPKPLKISIQAKRRAEGIWAHIQKRNPYWKYKREWKRAIIRLEDSKRRFTQEDAIETFNIFKSDLNMKQSGLIMTKLMVPINRTVHMRWRMIDKLDKEWREAYGAKYKKGDIEENAAPKAEGDF